MTQDNGFAFDDPQAFTRIWSEFASKMATAGVAFAPDAPPPEAARQVRDAILEAMGRYCEEYMRSPQFLQAMKQSMDSAIAFRRQINAFLTRWQHEMQGVAQEDVDSLMDRMGDLQKTVVRRIDAIADRLEEIAARLNRLESHDPEKSRKAAGTSSADERKPASAKAFSTAKTSKSPKSEKPKKSAKSGKSAKAGRSAKPGSSAKKRTRKQGY